MTIIICDFYNGKDNFKTLHNLDVKVIDLLLLLRTIFLIKECGSQGEMFVF